MHKPVIMTNKFTLTVSHRSRYLNIVALTGALLLSLLFSTSIFAATKTATTTGNWGTASIWSPSGVPAAGDDVIINSGITVTIDADDTCHNLSMGNNTAANTILKIIAGGNTLVCTGALDFNAGNKGNTYVIDAGPGDMSFTGTFSHWSASGTNQFKVGTGSMSFTPAVALANASQYIIFTGGGTINFSSDFSDSQAHMTFYTGCTVNFYASYTCTSVTTDWGGLGTANFYGTGTLSPTKDIKMNTVNIMNSAATTLASCPSGFLTVHGNLTVNASAGFTMNDAFQLDGSFTNNGTLTPGAITLTLKGSGITQTLGGTAALNLPTVQIGSGNGQDVTVVVAQNTTMAALTYSAGDHNRSVSVNTGKTLTVTGNLTMAQESKDNMVALLSLSGSGACTVSGNLSFTGTNNGVTRLTKIDAGSGSFTLTGTVTWMSNNIAATELITVGSGTVTFSSSVTMGDKSGTISATGSGTINFNGSSAPSLSFGGSTAPVLSASYGSTINIAKGLTTNTSALTLATGSNLVFTGTGTITPNSTLTTANIVINASCTVTAAGNFYVKGNWTDNGTFTPSTYTVTFNGSSTKTISKTGGETFYKLSATVIGATLKLLSDVMVTNTLTMTGTVFNLNGYTLTLGNSAAATLVRSAGQVYGGTFKRWFPASAITSTSGSYYGLFPMGTSTQYRYVGINSTVNPTTAGYVMATHTDGTGGTTVNYTDNGGSTIQQITNMHSDITTSGLAGGTYSIDVHFTGMGSQGNVSNFKLETYTGGTMGSCGTHVTTLGPVSAPTGKRSGLTMANLSNTWVIGTNDASGSPLYTYVYSRKTGNWNDASGTGTWSYTAGGSGAACSCVPGAGGYAVIEAGHTVTVTATDTAQFLDIKSGASLTINSGKVFNVTGNMDMFGTATFSNNGTLNVTGELLFSPSASQTFSGNVTVSGWFTLDSGATYTHTSGTLTVTGDMEINGAMSISTGANIAFSGVNSILSGTGTFTTASGGSLAITNDKTIDVGTSLTIGTSGTNTAVALAAGTTINNLGSITVNGDVTGANGTTSVWVNNANSTLNVTGALLSTGILDVATAPNIVNYNGAGAQTIKAPIETYHSMFASNAGTKSCPSDIIVDSIVNISGTVVLDESTHILYGDADLIMSGTSELKLSRSTDADIYPELRGIYTLTGGTVTITQTGDSAVVAAGPYYNLKLNGTYGYDLGAVSTVANNLDCQSGSFINNNSVLTVNGMFTYSSSATSILGDSIAVNGISITSGTIDDGANSIDVKGSGGWTLNSAATFTTTTGTVYFKGTSNQTLGGTKVTQSFNSLCVDKSSNTVTVGGSTTTLNLCGDMILNAGVLDKGTASAINMNHGNWNNNGGTFTAGSGTVSFLCDTMDQAIQGTASTETFNNVTINKPSSKLVGGGGITTLTVSGNMTLTAGTFEAGTARTIYMTGGNWTNNGGTFTPGTGTVTFNGTGAQAINGTTASQTFNKLTVNKSSNTLSVAGSTTSLTLSSDLTLSAGTFDKGTANNIYAAGNWTNNGGVFTYGAGTVHCNSGADQAINGTAGAQTFYNLDINNTGGNVNISGSTTTVTVNDTLSFTSGKIATGANRVVIPTTGTVTGAGTGKYIYGNEEIYIPNTAAPSRTFHVGDVSVYAPVRVDFAGTVTGSGSITGTTTAGDDAGIASSGINPSKSVNRTWDLTNNSVGGFTSYAPTFTYVTADIDAGAITDSFMIRRLSGGIWNTTTTGTRTSTSTQATGVTGFGRTQIGEKATISVGTHPTDTSLCSGHGTTFYSNSPSTPAPTVKWQRDPNTGSFADITGGMDGGVYTNYTTTTLAVSDVAGLTNYKYRAVFTNINGTATSNSATLTTSSYPTITGTTPGSRCDAGTVGLGATSSAGTINWYAASSGGGSLGTGTSYTTGSISSNTTYYVDATSGSCTTPSRTSVLATVNTTPTISGTTPGSRCDAGTVSLGASASAGTINWYAASSGGASLGTGTSYTTPSISSNTTYYVDATSSGCTTGSRTTVLATVNTTPTITGTTPASRCDAGAVSLGATSSAGTINWYSSASGGVSLGTGTSYNTGALSSNSTYYYYVDATTGGCTTASRTSVTATVTSTPTITGTTPGSHCDAGSVSLGATASAGTINWYAASSGGASLGTGTGYTTGSISSNTTYYVDATNGGCTTGSRTSVTATIHSLPTATIAYQSCAGVNGSTTIRIGGTGGTGPYTYKLNSGSFTSTDTVHIANASNQNYYVQDAFGCSSGATNYTATAIDPTQIPTSIGTTSCSCPSVAEGRDVYLTNASGEVIAVINDKGHNLGTITATAYIRGASVLVSNNQGGQDAAMGRSFVLDFNGTNLSPAVEVKFPYTDAEFNSLISASAATPIASDDVTTAADLGSTQYEGPGEDDTYNTSAATMLVYHRQLGNGTLLNGKYVKISLTSNGEHWLGGNGNGQPLPVKLVSFEAIANQTMEQVETKWTTSLEVNNAYFAVERSEDGTNFNEVGRVTGAGNYTGTLDYRFNDVKPFSGLSYYRLKQTDFDGDFTYSDIVAVTMGTQSSFRLYPNPTNSEINIDVANPSDEIKLTIYDLSGHEVFGHTYSGNAMNKNQVITLHAKNILPAGMYMVNVITNGNEFKQKLVVN